MKTAFAGAILLALAGATALAGTALTPAQLGQGLAQVLAAYAPVEVFRQQAAVWRLAGGTPPPLGSARAALEGVQDQLAGIADRISEGGVEWSSLLRAVQTASRRLAAAGEALAGRGLAEREGGELEDLLAALGEARGALDELLLSASDAAEAAGGGWEFQTAFLCQTVLLSPSPLYLHIQEEWQAYLQRNLPPGLPEKGVSALERLLSLANRGLTPAQEEDARLAAETLLQLLLPKVEGGA